MFRPFLFTKPNCECRILPLQTSTDLEHTRFLKFAPKPMLLPSCFLSFEIFPPENSSCLSVVSGTRAPPRQASFLLFCRAGHRESKRFHDTPKITQLLALPSPCPKAVARKFVAYSTVKPGSWGLPFAPVLVLPPAPHLAERGQAAGPPISLPCHPPPGLHSC